MQFNKPKTQADGPGNAATFVSPTHIASSGTGAVYVLDQNRIRKVQLPESARYNVHKERQRIDRTGVRLTTLPQQVPFGVLVKGMVHVPASRTHAECLVLSSATGFYKLLLDSGVAGGAMGSGQRSTAGNSAAGGAGSAATSISGRLEHFAGRDGANGAFMAARADGVGGTASASCISAGLARAGDGRVVFLDFDPVRKNTHVRCVSPGDGRVSTLYESLPAEARWEWPCILPNGCLAVTCNKELLIVDLGLPPPQPPPQPRSADEPPPRTLAADLGSLLDAGCAADVTIRVGEEAFRAHRAILIARCDYFAKRLAEDTFADGAQEELDLPDAEPGAFRVLLRWLYTGAADIPAATAADVATLADRLTLPELCAAAQAAVVRSVAPQTVVQSLLWAAACAPGRGSSFTQLLAQLKKWYVANYDMVRSQARESVVELMARNPHLAMELQEQLVAATERRASKKQRTR